MPVFEFDKKDINFGRVVEPAWYRVKINDIDEGTISKKGDSKNYKVDAEILFNGDNGDITFAGVNLGGFTWFFNDKAKGASIGFLKCFDVEVAEGQRVELKAAVGREIDVFVENSVYEGRVRNSVQHKYRKPKADVVAKVA